ncbi:Doublecortin domain-containing protein 2 [Nymphon striatum]|nr:Doublecortin domain-containing protein 2 [Nymphon striatum]
MYLPYLLLLFSECNCIWLRLERLKVLILSKTPKIFMCIKTGDAFLPGIRCLINPRQTRNFDSFLGVLTVRLKPSFGAVRNVYTPTAGHRVTDLEKLQSNQGYVAAGREKFKKVQPSYAQIGESKKKEPARRKSLSKVKPVTHSNIKASSRFRTANPKVITIYIYKNGDVVNQPVKFVLGPRDISNWDNLFQTIGEKVQLQSGFVSKLYKLDGSAVDVTDLENGKEYVAVGQKESFKKVNYGENKDWKVSAVKTPSRKGRLNLPKSKSLQNKTPASPETKPEKPFSFENSSQSRKSINSTDTAELNGSDRNAYSAANDREDRELNDLIRKMELESNFGVYRASDATADDHDAKEIQDTPDTLIDVPIDYREAEEVKEDLKAEVKAALHRLSITDPEQLIAVASNLQTKHKTRHRLMNRVSKNKNVMRAV